MESPGVDVTATTPDGGVLVAIAYADQNRAAEALAAMKRLQNDGALHLNDAVAIAKNEAGREKNTIDWAVSRTVAGAALGLVLGALAGLVLSSLTSSVAIPWPVIGALFGAAAGGWAGTFADAEHIDDFVLEVRDDMPPNSSAILMLVESMDQEKTLAGLRPYGGTVLRTTLPEADEARLRVLLTEPPPIVA